MFVSLNTTNHMQVSFTFHTVGVSIKKVWIPIYLFEVLFTYIILFLVFSECRMFFLLGLITISIGTVWCGYCAVNQYIRSEWMSFVLTTKVVSSTNYPSSTLYLSISFPLVWIERRHKSSTSPLGRSLGLVPCSL